MTRQESQKSQKSQPLVPRYRNSVISLADLRCGPEPTGRYVQEPLCGKLTGLSADIPSVNPMQRGRPKDKDANLHLYQDSAGPILNALARSALAAVLSHGPTRKPAMVATKLSTMQRGRPQENASIGAFSQPGRILKVLAPNVQPAVCSH